MLFFLSFHSMECEEDMLGSLALGPVDSYSWLFTTCISIERFLGKYMVDRYASVTLVICRGQRALAIPVKANLIQVSAFRNQTRCNFYIMLMSLQFWVKSFIEVSWFHGHCGFCYEIGQYFTKGFWVSLVLNGKNKIIACLWKFFYFFPSLWWKAQVMLKACWLVLTHICLWEVILSPVPSADCFHAYEVYMKHIYTERLAFWKAAAQRVSCFDPGVEAGFIHTSRCH